MRQTKIAIFMPREGTFYSYLLHAMCRGFEQAGVDVVGSCGLLPEGELVAFCRQYKPGIVIEMNRTRNDVPGLPRSVTHICWLVDLWGKSLNDYFGSEIILFFDPSWKKIYRYSSEYFGDNFPPGASLSSTEIGATTVLHDFSFAGHIPKPWNEEELNREISVDGGPTLRFGDIFDAVLRETAGNFASITPQKAVWRTKRLIRRGCRSRVPSGTKNERKIFDALGWLPTVLTYDVGTRLARLWGRRQLIERAINITESIGIYGPDNWALWEQYRKYYRGMIENPEDLSRVYRGSHINLHQGVGMHFRVLDCMAAGGVVFAMAREWENLPGEIGDYFEDGSEFVSFTINDFAEKASEILGDHKRRQKMQRAAAKAVATSHTWRHRAEQIMHDYQSL